jgi:hypothetical protein
MFTPSNTANNQTVFYTPVDRKIFEVLYKIAWVIVVNCAPPLDATNLKMATTQQSSWCILQLAKEESL